MRKFFVAVMLLTVCFACGEFTSEELIGSAARAGIYTHDQQLTMYWVNDITDNRILHESTLGEWKRALYDDKIAISAHWLASAKWGGHLQTPDNFAELRMKAQMLVEAVDNIAADDEMGFFKSNEIAATIIVMANDLGPSL